MKGTRLSRIELAHTALVLHDMQNDFIEDSLSRPEMMEVVKRTKALIDLAHSLPIPVIYTRVENDPRERLTAIVDAGASVNMKALMETVAA